MLFGYIFTVDLAFDSLRGTKKEGTLQEYLLLLLSHEDSNLDRQNQKL